MNRHQINTIFSNILCFLYAARHQSFTKAAEQLFLTQSAVSHRIRNLEECLGIKLFQRLTRKVALTEDGHQLFDLLEPMVGTIDFEISNILNREVGGTLNIATVPSFGICWLLPRLLNFQNKHPNIKINLRTRNDLIDFRTDAIDIAIYYGDGQYPGLKVTKLIDEQLFPVCSPEYAEKYNLWQDISRLPECLLLHDAMPWPKAQYFSEWEMWANHAGVKDLDYENSHSFDRADLAFLFAMNGAGLAMGRRCLVTRRIESRELVDPFGIHYHAQRAYYLACSHEKYKAPRIAAFRNWIMDQIQEQEIR
jgi:LysR family transcriptional regulator, D-serine deaminase activator